MTEWERENGQTIKGQQQAVDMLVQHLSGMCQDDAQRLIRQSIRTMHFDQNYEWIIIGCATVLAVVLDQTSARLTARQQTHQRGHRCQCDITFFPVHLEI